MTCDDSILILNCQHCITKLVKHTKLVKQAVKSLSSDEAFGTEGENMHAHLLMEDAKLVNNLTAALKHCMQLLRKILALVCE